MDPAVYARAHGVQSEANNVTVTRVACGEILYRRVVDSYRRDMRFKLNDLRKEQKRLRGCMRNYRRKLRESRQKEMGVQLATFHGKDKQPQNQVIVHAVTDVTTSEHSITGKHDFTNNSHLDIMSDKTVNRLNPVSAPTAEKQKLFNENEIKTPSARSCDPDFSQHTMAPRLKNVSPTNEPEEEQIKNETAKDRPGLTERVGRTVRKGSGKIGASSRQIHISVADSELEDDAFEDLSDSSDEELEKREKEVPTDVVSFRNGRFVREITPLTLMKSNAAYFKSAPKEMKTDKTDGYNEPADAVNNSSVVAVTDKPFHSLQSDIETIGSKEENLTSKQCPDPTLQGIPLRSMAAASNQSNKVLNMEKPKTEESKNVHRRKGEVGVSFNDIIKIQISNNTKKLFSLVDRLAKTNGIPVTPEQRQPKTRLNQNDPRENVASVRRTRAAERGFLTPGITTHHSVYYAIKYGYLSHSDDSTKHLDNGHPIPDDNGERGQTLTSRIPPSDSTRSLHLSELSTLSNTMSITYLSQNDNAQRFPTTSSFIESEDERHISKSPYDDVGSNLASFLMEQKEKQREKRRSSILEASKFVTSTRRRRSHVANRDVSPAVSEHHKREKDFLIRPRKDSVKPEHVEVSEENKESWTAAFSRIKMIHTLADLTHVI